MGTKGIKGEYTGFTFNGIHTEDLGITRVSGGDRYEMDLLPNFEDKTVDVPGGDGTYYFGSLYKNREFSFNLAYDGVTEQNLRQMQQLFGDRRVHPLVLDEYPFKTYYVRISSTPNFEYIAFDEGDPEYEAYIWTYGSAQSSGNAIPERIYKGEATIEFVCYEPWAHCIEKELNFYKYPKVGVKEGDNPQKMGLYELQNGEYVLTEDVTPDDSKQYYRMELALQWATASGLKESLENYDSGLGENFFIVYNPGDRPVPFRLIFPMENLNYIKNLTISFKRSETSPVISSITFKNEDVSSKNDNDKQLVYDSKLHLIYGIDAEGNKTGTVYNDYIDSGDFFDILQADFNRINPNTGEHYTSEDYPGDMLLFSKDTGSTQIIYDYLYF